MADCSLSKSVDLHISFRIRWTRLDSPPARAEDALASLNHLVKTVPNHNLNIFSLIYTAISAKLICKGTLSPPDRGGHCWMDFNWAAFWKFMPRGPGALPRMSLKPPSGPWWIERNVYWRNLAPQKKEMVYSSAATLEEDPAPTASVMVSIKIRNSRQSSGGHIDIPTVSSEELLSLWKGIQPAFCLLIATSKCLLELLTVRLSMFRAVIPMSEAIVLSGNWQSGMSRQEVSNTVFAAWEMAVSTAQVGLTHGDVKANETGKGFGGGGMKFLFRHQIPDHQRISNYFKPEGFSWKSDLCHCGESRWLATSRNGNCWRQWKAPMKWLQQRQKVFRN